MGEFQETGTQTQQVEPRNRTAEAPRSTKSNMQINHPPIYANEQTNG